MTGTVVNRFRVKVSRAESNLASSRQALYAEALSSDAGRLQAVVDRIVKGTAHLEMLGWARECFLYLTEKDGLGEQEAGLKTYLSAVSMLPNYQVSERVALGNTEALRELKDVLGIER